MKLRSIMLVLAGAIAIFTLIIPVQAAVPQQCIQQKNRVKACPHLLYRADKLPSHNTTQLLCICVTDFQPLLYQPDNEQQKIEQNMTRRQFEAEYGDDLAVILAILRHQR
ncbi:hypothetical protein [Arsukibacterium indicum]|uniref:Secreted protein n=1 Tax=Arsukibacterium indicum TaxID=2848612 RepID=A0ABS6MLM6_9GAMM|nr:hypothetical protein [Arsukibacterium indicum]MBV2129655.1 hypothetical protein [Arsukibacterium indicum]